MTNKQARSLILAAVGCLVLVIPSAAGANGLFHLRAYGVWVEPDLDYRAAANDEADLHVTANGGFGIGVSGEYQLSDRLGVELGIFRTTPEIVLDYQFRIFDLGFSVTDDLAMTPVSLALNIHLLPKERIDVYLSPFLAYVLYSDLEFVMNESFEVGGQTITIQDSARVQVEDDFAYGATLGVDVPFSSKPWAVATSLRYMATEMEATDPDGESIRPDFDSWILTLGVRYSF